MSVLAIDIIFSVRPLTYRPIPVRRPAIELIVATIFFATGLIWLLLRFAGSWDKIVGLQRLFWVIIGLGSVFNITLAIFLLAVRYSPSGLGIRFRGFLPVPFAILIFAALTIMFSRSSITWREIYQEYQGSLWLIIQTGVFSAALPEEFFRGIWQTRLGVVLNNRAIAWFIASLLWAVLHMPKVFGETHSLIASMDEILNIMPIGLLWGYLTIRTQSILPSVLLHSTNIWGLQNL